MRIALAMLAAAALAAACSPLPSEGEQAAARAAEGFSPGYRLAIASIQTKPKAEAYGGYGMGLVPGIFREIDKSITLSRVNVGGASPIARVDATLRDHAAAQLPADPTILDRALYGGDASLAGTDTTDIFAIKEAATRGGYDGLLYVNLEPVVSSSLGDYSLTLNTRIVLRSVKRDKLLMLVYQPIGCNPTPVAGGSIELYPLKPEELGDALVTCYDRAIAAIPGLIDQGLAGG